MRSLRNRRWAENQRGGLFMAPVIKYFHRSRVSHCIRDEFPIPQPSPYSATFALKSRNLRPPPHRFSQPSPLPLQPSPAARPAAPLARRADTAVPLARRADTAVPSPLHATQRLVRHGARACEMGDVGDCQLHLSRVLRRRSRTGHARLLNTRLLAAATPFLLHDVVCR